MTRQGTIRRIGPVEVNVGNHTAQWTGPPTQFGRDFSLGGSLREPETGRALLELVNNADARISHGRLSGVLAWLDGDGEYADLRGLCLLTSFTYIDGPANSDSDAGWGPFSLSATALGADVEVVVVRSARALDNDYAITGRAIVVQPFWGDDPDGEPFATPPGGTAFAREYDPRSYHDVRAPAYAGRRLRIHEGAVA